jgi:uncharacterized RDD family membrane protein YckC
VINKWQKLIYNIFYKPKKSIIMSDLYTYNKKRLTAAFIDLGGIILYVLILLGVSLISFSIIGYTPKLSAINPHLLGFLTLTLPVMIYFIVFEFKYSATPGKRFAGLKVVSLDGRRLALTQVIVRNIIKFLPWEYAHILVYILILVPDATNSPFLIFGLIIANIIPLIYIALVVFRSDHRGPHDLVAKTIVVDV